jgi:hypothetical protein
MESINETTSYYTKWLCIMAYILLSVENLFTTAIINIFSTENSLEVNQLII